MKNSSVKHNFKPYNQAMAINVGAVFSVVELAKKMKNLKALIHVSTAYCNTHLAW